MASSRVVVPETKLLQISNGDWLLVKTRLNHGEAQDAFARRYKATNTGLLVDLARVGSDRVTAYLVDWSLVDPGGKKLAIAGTSPETIEAALNLLDEDSVKEIKEAVEAHEQAMDEEREASKKIQDGAIESSATSPSLVGVTGDMSGSAN